MVFGDETASIYTEIGVIGCDQTAWVDLKVRHISGGDDRLNWYGAIADCDLAATFYRSSSSAPQHKFFWIEKLQSYLCNTSCPSWSGLPGCVSISNQAAFIKWGSGEQRVGWMVTVPFNSWYCMEYLFCCGAPSSVKLSSNHIPHKVLAREEQDLALPPSPH